MPSYSMRLMCKTEARSKLEEAISSRTRTRVERRAISSSITDERPYRGAANPKLSMAATWLLGLVHRSQQATSERADTETCHRSKDNISPNPIHNAQVRPTNKLSLCPPPASDENVKEFGIIAHLAATSALRSPKGKRLAWQTLCAHSDDTRNADNKRARLAAHLGKTGTCSSSSVLQLGCSINKHLDA
eukprot:scaffold232453_cov31-Tisochrysis_lutea.AAC.5